MHNIKRIVIIEDNNEVRESLELLLKDSDDYLVINTYPNCENAIPQIQKDLPHLILMDIDLPGINGVEGTKRIKKIIPEVLILMITVIEDNETVFEALCAGAIGYLSKSAEEKRILHAITDAFSGGAPMSSNIAKKVVESFHRNFNTPLTDRETEVLTLLSENKSYADISTLLFITKDTVKFHIRNIYQKLQVNNKADAIEMANKNRWI
ncbi:MAG: response regulator [Cytophagaceae bacterium]